MDAGGKTGLQRERGTKLYGKQSKIIKAFSIQFAEFFSYNNPSYAAFLKVSVKEVKRRIVGILPLCVDYK